MADRVLDSGCEGARIVWVRLADPVCNMFIIVVYVPHRVRTKAPFAKDIIKLLNDLLTTVKLIKETASF